MNVIIFCRFVILFLVNIYGLDFFDVLRVFLRVFVRVFMLVI